MVHITGDLTGESVLGDDECGRWAGDVGSAYEI